MCIGGQAIGACGVYSPLRMWRTAKVQRAWKKIFWSVLCLIDWSGRQLGMRRRRR
jgi:hypothetical protein